MYRLLATASVLIFGLMALAAPALAQGNCSTVRQNLTVSDIMDRHYLWYEFIPDVDPARFSSPEAYLDAVRYRPLDRGFTYLASRAETDAYYNDSQFVGFGLSTRVEGRDIRVLQVFAGGPADEAGLARGHRILEINGQSADRLIRDDALGSAWGPATPGVEVEVRFESRDGIEHRRRIVKRLVTIPTIPLTRVFDIGGRTVGYFELRNFVEPSHAALEEAVAAFRDAGVSELVIDLRYNGGGLVDVAVHLASLVGGAAARGQLFAEMQHNDKNRSEDVQLRFQESVTPLELSRLIVITTRSSASASELLINGLRPYLPVTVIGDATYGKPVGQHGFNFCDKTLAAVAFAIVNARGEAGYFDGIAADCSVPDDTGHDLGDPAEASLAEALHYVGTGACSTAASAGSQRHRVTYDRSLLPTGWRGVINAQ